MTYKCKYVTCTCNKGVESSLTVGELYPVVEEFTYTYVVLDDNNSRIYHEKTRFGTIQMSECTPNIKSVERWIELTRSNANASRY